LSDQSLTNQQIIVISQAQEYKRQFSKLSSQKKHYTSKSVNQLNS